MSFWNGTSEDSFPESPAVPKLSRDVCLNPKGLRSFLKLSRANTDDVIKQRLNSLLNDKTHSKDQICQYFTDEVIHKSWNDRLRAIEFCDSESAALEKEIESNQEAELQEKYVDPRIDPYAANDFMDLKNSKYDQLYSLKNWVNNEKLVEDIVRARSTEILNDSCVASRWSREFKEWSASQK